MKSIFFIPASKLNKISVINSLGVNEIIIDLEDSIFEKDRPHLIESIVDMKEDLVDYWLRVPLREYLTDKIDITILTTFNEVGFKKFVLPKVNSYKELKSICKVFYNRPDCQLILLIEYPKLLLQLNKILTSELGQLIKGIGIGSHDLMNFIGAEHSESQLQFPRMQCLYYSKAYNKMSIDIASMNINDQNSFNKEMQYSLSSGFDAKFLVHPNQIEWFKIANRVSNAEIKWAKDILNAIPDKIEGKDIEPFILNGEIIEKPHLEKAIHILKQSH